MVPNIWLPTERAQAEIADTRQRIAEIEDQIETEFLAALGLTKPQRVELPKVFAVSWKDFERWSVSYNQRAVTSIDISRGRYPLRRLGECLVAMQYGTSEKANQRGAGVPILRINNIKGGAIDTSDLKHIDLRAKAISSLLLSDGDILVIRTSGSGDLVGTCAVFHEQGEFVFASYLIRMVVDRGIAHPDYVGYFLNCSLGRQQVEAMSRHIMQNNINSEELRSIELPLPPLPVQCEIVAKMMAKREEIKSLKAEAERKAEQAKTDVNAMILGDKRVTA